MLTIRKTAILITTATMVLTGCGDNAGRKPNAQNLPKTEPAVSIAWRDAFSVTPADLATEGRNPFFILEPGYQQVLKGKEDGVAAKLVITVLNEIKTVAGYQTRVVEERESKNGRIVEISQNYFAIDRRTNDVYYFGEDVDIYKHGKVINHEDSWHAGENGAKFGLLMPGSPKVGDRYYQELAPNLAMDRAEVVSVTESVHTPAGDFVNCLKTREGTGLNENEEEYKIYAPGIGLVKEEELLLIRTGKMDKSDEEGGKEDDGEEHGDKD